MDREKVKSLKKHRDDAEETVDKLRQLGLARGEEYDGLSPREVLDKMQEIDMEQEVLEVNPIGEKREVTADGKVKYQMSDKSHAVAIMRAYQRRYAGEIMPNYSKVSRLLGIPQRTLINWWEDRQKIQEAENRFMSDSWHVIKMSLHEQLLRLTMSMRDIDYSKGKIKEVSMLLDKIIQNLRLLENKSTENVEKREHQTIQVLPPDAAIAGVEPGHKGSDE